MRSYRCVYPGCKKWAGLYFGGEVPPNKDYLTCYKHIDYVPDKIGDKIGEIEKRLDSVFGSIQNKIFEIEQDVNKMKRKFRCMSEGHKDKSIFEGNDRRWYFHCKDCGEIISEAVITEKKKARR